MESDRSRNVSLLLIAVIAGFAFFALLSGIGIGAWFTPEARTVRQHLRPDVLLGARLVWWAGVLACTLGFTAAALRLMAWAMEHLRDPLLVHPKYGLYPATVKMALQAAPNEPGAQRVAALTHNQHDQPLKLSGAAVKAAVNPKNSDEAMLPSPEQSPDVTPQEAFDVDPRTRPHTILIGETGSGKSRATFLLLSMLTRRYPCEVLVLEREAIDWNTQSAVLTTAGYVDALRSVEAERQRRAEMMRAEDVQHALDLQDPPKILVVLIEEAESVYSELAIANKEQARQYNVLLGNLARLCRKEAILLVVTTQTGTTGVFDTPTRKQFGTRLFFRSEPQVGDSWGIPRNFQLPKLPTGTAFSLRHGGLVSFPLMPRPQLPLSRLYHEPQLSLPADAEADGLGADDLPSSEPFRTDVTTIQGGSMPVITVKRPLDSKLKPTPEEARAMREHYRRTGSKTAVCHHFYDGNKNGDIWAHVMDALEGRI